MGEHEEKIEIMRKYLTDMSTGFYCHIGGEVPSKKINNALKTFAQGMDSDTIIGFYDTTSFGSGKNGYIFTDDKMYYVEMFEKPKKLWYDDIKQIRMLKSSKKDSDRELAIDFLDGSSLYIEGGLIKKTPLKNFLNEMKNFDAVLINDLPDRQENRLIKLCYGQDKRVYFTPKLSDILVKGSEELNLFDTPLYLRRNNGIPYWKLAVKRFFDIILSLIALIILGPILLLVALAIKLEDGGPVFYKQERCTINGNKFMIIKFRSMIVDAEKDGKPHPATEHDDRITKVGKFIRACRIDELPQLFNILKGDMSIVGPRPERVEHVEKYTSMIPEFSFREKVKGGLTGYAQVYGKYNTTALDKLKLDLIYITNYSLLLDIQIIFETVKILFQKESTEGFSESQEKDMEDFPNNKDKEIW